MFGRRRRQREASSDASVEPTTPDPAPVPAIPEALPRIEQALVALVVHARQIDDRLSLLEQRLDEHALDLTVVASRDDLDRLRAESAALGATILDKLGDLTRIPEPVPTEPRRSVPPLFAPLDLPRRA